MWFVWHFCPTCSLVHWHRVLGMKGGCSYLPYFISMHRFRTSKTSVMKWVSVPNLGSDVGLQNCWVAPNWVGHRPSKLLSGTWLWVRHRGERVKGKEASMVRTGQLLTTPEGILPGQYAMVGSLIPPSKVVCFPHKNGPLLPPTEQKGNKCLQSVGLVTDKKSYCSCQNPSWPVGNGWLPHATFKCRLLATEEGAITATWVG